MIVAPFAAPGVHVKPTNWFPAVPVTDVGVPGRSYGPTALEVEEKALVPPRLMAAMRNTYDDDADKPVKLYEVLVVPVFDEAWFQVPPLFVEYCTTYPVMAEPFAEGAVQFTVMLVRPGVPVTPVGALGALYTVTAALLEEYPLVPAAVRVATRKMYATPPVKPVTVFVVADVPVFDVAVVHEVPPLVE